MIRYNGRAVVHDHVDAVLDIVNAAGMHELYGTYVDDDCFDIHEYDDDTDHDSDDDTDDDTDGDTDGDDVDDGKYLKPSQVKSY